LSQTLVPMWPSPKAAGLSLLPLESFEWKVRAVLPANDITKAKAPFGDFRSLWAAYLNFLKQTAEKLKFFQILFW